MQGDDAWRLQLLIDSIVDYAIYMIDIDGRIASWNSGAVRLNGYSAEEIVGQPFAKSFTPEDQARELPQQALAIATRTGRFESEGWRVRKDGTRFRARSVIASAYDLGGQLTGFAEVTHDMTAGQLVQNRFLEGDRRVHQHFVEAVIDYAIFQLNKDGIIVTWNAGAERIKGYTADEIIGRHFSCLYCEEDRATGIPMRALAIAENEGKFEAEGWRLRKDGTRFWASVVIDPIRSDSGELIGFAKVTRDITERMETQRLLGEIRERLAASQRLEAIGQLSGGIAHDFNNLLSIILGNLDLAQQAARTFGSAANTQRWIANAMRGAQRAATLTHRLLAFSRRLPLDPKVLDVNKYLSGIADFLQRTLGEMVRIEVAGAAGLWPIEVDVAQLEVTLVNLAINARDAMQGDGKLTVEAFNQLLDHEYCRSHPEVSPGQYVLISVTDTGSGMEPDILARAFEPFFTTKEMGQGTGLGLSQVYGFIKQSGGHVKVYSEPGQGTTVKMYFPRSGDQASSLGEGSDMPIGEAANETILVVEDDKDVRAYLIEVLRNLNYRVIGAQDAVAALGILEQSTNRIDLMLTDVVMPGMNGRELSTRARDLRPRLKILFMSGYSPNAVVHQGRVDLDVQLIQKPISPRDLSSRLRDMLD
jgi:PAS domain S-box-containing protein